MTIMVTNDDGLTDGLRALTEAAFKLDNEVYAIIPSQQRSAVAKGLTMHKILRIRRLEEQGPPIYLLNGTPADCVAFALRSGEFKKPDLILAGVNIGDNLSYHSIYSSGTIGACIEALFYEIPAIAFSYELHGEEAKRANYVAWPKRKILEDKLFELTKKLKSKIPAHTLLNVNLPADFENSEVVFPKPAILKYVSMVEKRLDPHGTPYYWHYGERDWKYEKGSDVYELTVNRCITVTPLNIFGIVDEKLLEKLRKSF